MKNVFISEKPRHMKTLNIGTKIKKLRELKNLTQEHMANVIGVTQGAYSRMELRETEIT
jgi:transcriptional regulator with XRE-family HTH domain